MVDLCSKCPKKDACVEPCEAVNEYADQDGPEYYYLHTGVKTKSYVKGKLVAGDVDVADYASRVKVRPIVIREEADPGRTPSLSLDEITELTKDAWQRLGPIADRLTKKERLALFMLEAGMWRSDICYLMRIGRKRLRNIIWQLPKKGAGNQKWAYYSPQSKPKRSKKVEKDVSSENESILRLVFMQERLKNRDGLAINERTSKF